MIQIANHQTEPLPEPPDCRQVLDRLQSVLDGELPGTTLKEDPHPASCRICRERIVAARLLWKSLRIAHGATPLPATSTETIVEAILLDRKTLRNHRLRRRGLVSGLAIAAGILVLVWMGWTHNSNEVANRQKPSSEAAPVPGTVVPSPQAIAVTQPPTIRLGEELARAEVALVNSSRPITEPAKVAPQVFDKLTELLTRSTEPEPEFDFARTSLLELPEAARSGFQPVTETTQKAFTRLFHDMGAIQPPTKPN